MVRGNFCNFHAVNAKEIEKKIIKNARGIESNLDSFVMLKSHPDASTVRTSLKVSGKNLKNV